MNPDLLAVLMILLAFSLFLLIGVGVIKDNNRALKRMEERGWFDKKTATEGH